MANNTVKYLIYNLPESKGAIDAIIQDETIWATQKAMAMLFDTMTQNITQHLQNIFQEGELQEVRTCKDFLQVRGTIGTRPIDPHQ